MSSVAWTAPLSYRPSDAEIVIRRSLMPSRANAIKEMLKICQFIASNWDLKETPLALGVANTPVCSSNLICYDDTYMEMTLLVFCLQFCSSKEMEFCKSLFAAIFIVTTISSVAWTAPLSYRPSDAEIVIRRSLMPSRSNAIEEMLMIYQFIASNWDLKETVLALGKANTPVCSSNLQKKENLTIAFIQLYNFIHPLYLAYSYEEAKGSQHKELASALKETSFHLNTTVWRIKKTGSQTPTAQHVLEASLDHSTKTYLQAVKTTYAQGTSTPLQSSALNEYKDMEFYNVLLAITLMTTTLSSVSFTAPLGLQISNAEFVIRLFLMPARGNTTKEMLNVYKFIASNWNLKETPLVLGVGDNLFCSSHLQKQENLSIAYIQLHNFMSPLYMAHSYEEQKGFQHNELARAIHETSFHLNYTVGIVENEIRKIGFQPPQVPHESEAVLDRYTHNYLQAQVKNNLLMDCFKALFSTIFMVTLLSSESWTAPLSYRPSNAEILIRLLLMPTRANATKEMLNVHKFIASNWNLKETPLALGVADTPICSSNMKKRDRLAIALIQLHNFIRPLYLAYASEKSRKESQHKLLTRALKNTSLLLNYTVQSVKSEIHRNDYQMTSLQDLPEAQMNRYTREYLQALVEDNLLFLLLCMGMKAATCKHSCVWCTCSNEERNDFTKPLTFFLKLKHNLNPGWYKDPGCSTPPLFDVPLERFMIDELHMVLQITDILEKGIIHEVISWDEDFKELYDIFGSWSPSQKDGLDFPS
ncbi:hypothetical protein AWC38_SpisGene2553 [Stylophora pistillata]|uniref:Uncharacterized protein n=1 Tax=Stylophora pistillata TaxID=50429 RepID=A0A2B4SVX9_STYPI|nr:hypothetical protein AWC38_SpisGene2553 [Stylophora pistillata]